MGLTLDKSLPFNERKYVFLSARVHPGESNSSHIMNGLIQFLLSNDEVATNLRQNVIFKIVPMLNPDGVINGSHRCSLAGVDLNRQWKTPSRLLSPTVFWTKLMYRFIVKLNKQPLLACDFHGHSRKKNAFLFGCENIAGTELENVEKIFSQLLAQSSPLFDLNSCRFNTEKSKESTARVVLRRDFGIVNSFTLESTYCGMDVGEKKGYQIQISDMEKLGVDFAKAVNLLLTHPDVPLMTAQEGKTYSQSSNNTSPASTPKRPRKVTKKKVTLKQMGKKKSESKKKTMINKEASQEKDEDEPSDDHCSSDDDDDGE